jgi:hypothetical protein
MHAQKISMKFSSVYARRNNIFVLFFKEKDHQGNSWEMLCISQDQKNFRQRSFLTHLPADNFAPLNSSLVGLFNQPGFGQQRDVEIAQLS